jgi:hypothetical protein
VSSSAPSGRLAALRWIIGLLLMTLLGLVGFVAYTRYLRPSEAGSAGASGDPRLDAFLSRADERLVVGDLDGAKEQYVKASGVSDRDARVVLGLARVEILRAELSYWRWLSLDETGPERAAAEQELTQAVRRAGEAIDHAVEKAPTDGGSTRLQVDRLRLEAMVIYVLARTGKKEAADKSLAGLEARHRSHPLLEPLRRIVQNASKPRGPSDAGAEPVAPDASASASAAAGKGRRVDDGNYEFDQEPTPPHPSPGELELPAKP